MMSNHNSVNAASSVSSSDSSAFSLADFLSYSEVRDYLQIRLLNYAHNMESLEHTPYVLVEDMAVVFYYSPVVCGEPAVEPRLITSQDLASWGLGVFQIYRDALISSMNLAPAVLAPMQDLIGLPEEEAEDSFPMYVLSCRQAQYGAAAALYPDVLANIAEGFHDNLYLIPSSIHEWIILRAATICDPGAVEKMIHEINQTEVLPGEVLSDSLYFYDADDDELCRVGSRAYTSGK